MISGLFSLPISTLAESPEVTPRAFVAGPENALVRALAAQAIAERPDYNPLVLCGPSGAGKSSLAQLLTERRRAALQLKNLVITTGGDLVRGLAHAIDSDSASDFRARHQRCELLLIDEVHRLAGKPAAQQFVVAALDALVKRGALVIATLPRLPQATPGLLPALVSRLSGGLIVSLQPPGLLARRELVRQFAEQAHLPLTAELVAELAGDVDPAPSRALLAPRLRHAVLQRAAGTRFKVSQTDRSLGTADQASDPKQVFRQVAMAVSKHFDLTLAELKGKSRRQHLADARGLAMYVARRVTGSSYASIGRFFGNRDHTTVLHACQKTERLVQTDESLRGLMEDLTGLATSPEGA